MTGIFARFRHGPPRATEKTPHDVADGPNGDGQATAQDPEAGREEYEGWVDPYGPPPTVKQWIKWYWHDVVA
jgi:hypothetical protein